MERSVRRTRSEPPAIRSLSRILTRHFLCLETGEIVQTLTVHVTTKSQEFRRNAPCGKPWQTDFALNAAGAGPMEKRQKEPLDKELVLLYTLTDSVPIAAMQGGEKHTLITSAGAGHH